MEDKPQCISEPLKIDIKDVLDFCWCPRYYDLKRKDPEECNMKEAYDKSLHKCFYQYLYNLQQNTLKNTLEFLKYQWGKEWIKQKRNTEIILTPSAAKRDTYANKRTAGIDAIITFDNIMRQTEQFPLIINKPYELRISKGIILTGTWEYIREIGDEVKVFQILKFKTENNRFQVNTQMQHDIELTAASMAFMQTFNVKDAPELIHADMYRKHLSSSYRTKGDYDLLRKTVISVAQCIKHNIRCVSPDKKCYHCEYRNVCSSAIKST